MSTSSSSPTYPTTQQEHSVHPAHLQDHPVDKLRHQESLWRKDLQSGGNRGTTTPTETLRKPPLQMGEVNTNEEAIAYVKDLDLFVTVQLLEDTPPVL